MFAAGDPLCFSSRSSFNAMGGGGDSLTSSRCGVIGGLLGSGTVRGSTSSSNRLLLFEKDEMYEIFFFWIRSRREGRLLRRGRLSIKVEDGRRAGRDVLSAWPQLLGKARSSYAVHSYFSGGQRVWQFGRCTDAKPPCVHLQLLCGL
jgi:hypothetical protein